jgi:hypothetical protein
MSPDTISSTTNPSKNIMLSQSIVRSLSLIVVFAAAAVASAEETLSTPRSIMLTAGQEQTAQPVILAARRYAAFWNTGEPRYAEAALARDFFDRTLPPARKVLRASSRHPITFALSFPI